jgi:DNA ligase (NAD+)
MTIHNATNEMLLRKASEAYYNGTPIMSDQEFDALWQQHEASRKLSPNHPCWDDTILDKVGAKPVKTSGFKKVAHATPMLSLDNVFETDDGFAQVEKWLDGIPPAASVVVEPKVDGLSLSLVYENGILSDAVTRGDGMVGDSVIQNIHPGMGIPQVLIQDGPWSGAGNYTDARGRIEVRGEVYMPVGVFERLNAELVARGEEPYANPRNAAAGALRLHDRDESVRRGLRFVAYACSGYPIPVRTHCDEMMRLLRAGFDVVGRRITASVVRCENWREISRSLLEGMDFQTDGLVLKLNAYDQREKLGSTARAPRWAVALKFKQPEVTTIMRAITVQVGRSGVLTPVAELEPVEVDGSVVSRATLHNEDHINRLGLCIGDTVMLQKAGGIIPEIVRSLQAEQLVQKMAATVVPLRQQGSIQHSVREALGDVRARVCREESGYAPMIAARVGTRGVFNLLVHIGGKCPSCGSTDVKKQETIRPGRAIGKSTALLPKTQTSYFCVNPSCRAKLTARVQHMASRGCLDIEQLGSEACDEIAFRMPLEGMTHPFEILRQPVGWFAALSWKTEEGKKMTFGQGRAKKVVAAIERARTLPLNRWLAACGIPSVGENTSKEISRLFQAPDDLKRRPIISEGHLLRMIAAGEDKTKGALAAYAISHHLGPVSAQALLDFLESDDGIFALTVMSAYGVKSDNWNPTPAPKTDLPLSGQTFAITGTLSVGRAEMQKLIEAAGGKVSDTISKKLTALICGEGGGSKRDKAAALDLPVWDETRIREAML